MLAQILWIANQIGEVSCPTKYFPEASSINFRAQRCLWIRVPGDCDQVQARQSGVY